MLASEGIPVRTLGMRSAGQVLSAAWQLRQLLDREQPDILHCHMSHAILLGRIARLAHRVPVMVGTLHGLKMYNVRGTGWRLREFANGLTDWLSDATTVVCDAAAKHYVSSRAVSPKGLRVVPNGVDTRSFSFDPVVRRLMRSSLGIKDDEFVWLQVGRFQPVKDHHTMMRAFPRVLARHPNALLLLAGNGPLRQEVIELAQALGIGNRVRFLGTRSDIPALMNAADACVLSSSIEAMPMVLLEAASSGLPAVATDVGGVSDIVIEGKTGLLVPPRNPDALASAMSRLTAFPVGEREQMGLRARHHVLSQYSLEAVVDRWEALYRNLLDAKGVRK